MTRNKIKAEKIEKTKLAPFSKFGYPSLYQFVTLPVQNHNRI